MKKTLILVTAGILLALMVLPVFAVHGGGIIVGNELVMRIRYSAGGMTIQERADQVTVRINNLLGCPKIDVSQINVRTDKGISSIRYGDDLIITVDQQTAAANKMRPAQLAEIWANNLRRVLPNAKAGDCGSR